MTEHKNTIATPITDKNGKQTTVHKNATNATIPSRAVPAPVNSEQATTIKNISGYLSENYDKMNADLINDVASIITSTPRVLTTEETIQQTAPAANKLGIYRAQWGKLVLDSKRFWSVFRPTEDVNYLELNPKDESLPWADRYTVMLAYSLAEHGTPLTTGDDTYSWKDKSYINHIGAGSHNECRIAEITEVVEHEWTEYQNTFVENSEHQGFQGKAQCACGWFNGQVLLEGTLSELIRKLQDNISI